MARPGKHKAKYDRYKAHNHIAENKAKRQERVKKREEKFAKRRELKAQGHVFDAPSGKRDPYNRDRSNKTTKGHNIISKMRSMNRLLDNAIVKVKLEEKKKEEESYGKKKEKQVGDS